MRSDGCPDRGLVTLAPVAGERRVAVGALSRTGAVSALPPEFGADLGAEISLFAHADRENCSEE
jgi:hypothetical protein